MNNLDVKDEMTVDLPMAQAMTITAATALARAWLASQPAASDYQSAGWGVAVEMKLSPAPVMLTISFIDPSDGVRYPHSTLELPVVVAN